MQSLVGLELPWWLGTASLAFYPLAFYLLVGFCLGEFTEGWALLQGQVLTLEVGGRVLRAEAVAIAIAAAWSWIRTLAGGRTYHLPDGKGGDVKVVKWDPDHGALAMSCLLSPIHAVYLLVPDVTRDAEGNNRPSIQMLLVATLHGYMSLAAAHMFLRREHAQRKINNSSYALEVDQRNLEMNRRRKAEREMVDSTKHKSKQFLSPARASGAGGSSSSGRAAGGDDVGHWTQGEGGVSRRVPVGVSSRGAFDGW